VYKASGKTDCFVCLHRTAFLLCQAQSVQTDTALSRQHRQPSRTQLQAIESAKGAPAASRGRNGASGGEGLTSVVLAKQLEKVRLLWWTFRMECVAYILRMLCFVAGGHN